MRCLAFALVATLALGHPAQAQQLISGELGPSQPSNIYTHRVEPGDSGYDMAFRCAVSPFSIGVVTLARTSGSSRSRHDLEVANRINRAPNGGIVATDIISTSEGGSRFPQVAVIPPGVSETSYPVVTHARDDLRSTYRIYCRSVNLGELALWAGVKTAGAALLRGYMDNSDYNTGPNIDRAFNLLWGLITNNNFMSLGVEVIKDELRRQLNAQSPDTPNLNYFLVEVVGDGFQAVYQDAFYEMSGYR